MTFAEPQWATSLAQPSPALIKKVRVRQIEKRAEEEQGPQTRAPTLLPSGLWEKLLVVDHHCIWIQLEPAVPAFGAACRGHMIQFTQFHVWEEQASLDHALQKEHVCSPASSPSPPDRTWWELGAVSDEDSNHAASGLSSSGPLLSGMFCDRSIFLSCLFKPWYSDISFAEQLNLKPN